MDCYLGVDPGWKNLGWCYTDSEGRVLKRGTLNPSSLDVGSVGLEIFSKAPSGYTVRALCMERYVYYKGHHNADSEHILMVTGQIQSEACRCDIPIYMFKAVEWKRGVVQYLSKIGKKNPHTSLDKKFSLWAGTMLTSENFKVDHEADAGCLSWLAREFWERQMVEDD